MNNQNGKDVENKYKDTTDKFLNFMKEVRLKERNKQVQDDESNAKDATSNVSNFMQEVTITLFNAFNRINYWVDVMLASSKRIKILSLFLTLTLCYFVNGGSGITTTKSIDYINDVPVEVRVNPDYHVINYDKTVTVQLIGDFGSIQWAKIMDDFKVVLNVENKTEGNYDVAYTVEGISSNLKVQILPENTNVNLSKIEKRSFALDYHFTNEDKLDAAYILKDVRLGFSEVEVTAGTATLNRIDRVVANIDVQNITSSVVDQVAKISALDANGNVLDVKFSDKEVTYDLDVVTFSKVVPIRLEKEGDVNSSYILTELSSSDKQVTIYGQEEDLKDIEYIVAKVPIDGKAGNTTINSVALEKPENVTKMSIKSISVNIHVEEKVSKTIDNISIKIESLSPDYVAKFVDKQTASIKVTGPKSKLDKLNYNNLKVYVDLTNAQSGSGKYDLIIANQDADIEYQFVNGKTVDLIIREGE